MADKKFNNNENEEVETSIKKMQNKESSPLRVGKFVRISGSEIIVDVGGNGERIPYNPKKHSLLKFGDELELPR